MQPYSDELSQSKNLISWLYSALKPKRIYNFEKYAVQTYSKCAQINQKFPPWHANVILMLFLFEVLPYTNNNCKDQMDLLKNTTKFPNITITSLAAITYSIQYTSTRNAFLYTSYQN